MNLTMNDQISVRLNNYGKILLVKWYRSLYSAESVIGEVNRAHPGWREGEPLKFMLWELFAIFRRA